MKPRRFVIHYRTLFDGQWSRWYYDRKSQTLPPGWVEVVDLLNFGRRGEVTVFGWKNILFRVKERQDSPQTVVK